MTLHLWLTIGARRKITLSPFRSCSDRLSQLWYLQFGRTNKSYLRRRNTLVDQILILLNAAWRLNMLACLAERLSEPSGKSSATVLVSRYRETVDRRRLYVNSDNQPTRISCHFTCKYSQVALLFKTKNTLGEALIWYACIPCCYPDVTCNGEVGEKWIEKHELEHIQLCPDIRIKHREDNVSIKKVNFIFFLARPFYIQLHKN